MTPVPGEPRFADSTTVPPVPADAWEGHPLREEYARLREELMRCGLLAVSERQDGSIGKKAAERIREIAHRNCWPEGETG